MILLTEPADINKYFAMEDHVYDLLYPGDLVGDMAPKFVVLKTNSVETMMEGMMHRDAGEVLNSLGYDFIMPVFKELPDAIEASRNFRYPIAVVGLKDRTVSTGDMPISKQFE